MWPFVAKPPLRLEDIVGPTPIAVVTRVVSGNEIASPVSGLRAAFLQLEALERVKPSGDRESGSAHGRFYSLGTVILGDLVRLELEGLDVTVELEPRRVELRLVHETTEAPPIDHAIPEIVPLLASAKRGGVLCQREHLVLRGDRLRLCAIVERSASVVSSGYRSGVGSRLVVRADLAPVVLHEVLEASRF